MKNRIIVSLLVMITKFGASAQTPSWNWVKAVSNGPSDGWCKTIKTDLANNVYITGVVTNELRIGTNSLRSNGRHDLFLAKMNSSGNVLWAFSSGGRQDDEPYDLIADKDGNSYLCGSFQDTLILGNDTLTTPWISGFPSYQLFYAKFDNNGRCLWAKTAKGGTAAYQMSFDSKGNIVIGGFIDSSMQLGPYVLTSYYNSANRYGLFYAKMDTSGQVIWARQSMFGGDLKTMKLDKADNIYLSGRFGYQIKFDTLSIRDVSTGNSSGAIFTVKLDSSGRSVWGRAIGIAAPGTTNAGTLYGGYMQVDDTGNVYVGGNANNAAILFGRQPAEGGSLGNLVLAKYGENGTLLWGKTAPNAVDFSVTGIVLDKAGAPCIAGATSSPMAFGSYIFYPHSGNGSYSDGFIARYKKDGSFSWVQGIGGSSSASIAAVTSDAAGKIVVAGASSSNPCNFGAQSFSLDPGIFLAGLDVPAGISAASPLEKALQVFPNPAADNFTARLASGVITAVRITDQLGRSVYYRDKVSSRQVTISLPSLPDGIYEVRVNSDDMIMSRKILVQH